MARPVTAIVIGAGQRGRTYSNYALDFPDQLKIVAVAEPREYPRRKLQEAHGLPTEAVFLDWRQIAALPRMADCALVCTQDADHCAPAVALAALGYHLLLEKPMATTEADCEAIAAACDAAGVMLCVCHVLRYAPHNLAIKRLLDMGAIGDLVSVQHLEPVGHFHFAHSYVRGNWRNVAQSSPTLLAKSCHDVDLLRFWFGEHACEAVSSFGALQHFVPAQQPAAAAGATRCGTCPIAQTGECVYSAAQYLTTQSGWINVVLGEAPATRENIAHALNEGPYGRCVYHCDNDAVDNQVVNFRFAGNRTAAFQMIAFTKKMCERSTVLFGTRGQIHCDSSYSVVHTDFASGDRTQVPLEELPANTRMGGHGGADFFLMRAFVAAVGTGDRSLIRTSAADALASHKLVFAAERARLTNTVVTL